MKKKILLFVVLFTLVLGFNVKADSYTPENVPNISYIIGTHLFTRRPAAGSPYQRVLTTEWIMLASKTISGDTYESLGDRIIYYKASGPDENGDVWFNAITDLPIPESELPTAFNIEYKDGVKLITSPTAYLDWNETDDPSGYNKYLINDQGLLYANIKIQTNDNNIDGYEVYDINNQPVVSGPVTGPLSIIGPIQILKPETTPATYYVKVYKTYGETNMYSSPSPTFVLDFNMVMPTPTLNQVASDTLYRYNEQTRKIVTDVKVSLAESDQGAIINGYDIFKVNNEGEDEVIATASTDGNATVYANLGETASFYAKAYRGNENNKIYGEKSENLKLTFRNAVPTKPTLVQYYEDDYSKYLVQSGNLTARVKITLPADSIADGYDIFDENDDLVNADDVDPAGIVNIEGSYNTPKTYYAQTYVKYCSNNVCVKDYSENSSVLTLDFLLTLPTPTLVQDVDASGDAFYYDNTTDMVATNVHIEYAEGVFTNNVEGYEVFEQLNPQAESVYGGLTDHVTLYGELEAPKTFFAKAYRDINGTRVYSESSSPLSLQFNNAAPLTPVLNHLKTNGEYYYYDELVRKMATKVNISINGVAMDGYDIFDSETNLRVTGGDMNEDVVIYGDLGVEKSYYAKTFRLYGEQKHYSDSSQPLTFNYRNGVNYTPVLSLDWYSAIDENGYNKYYVDLDGKLSADVSIDYIDQVIDGYDVFNSNDAYVTTGLPDENVKLNGIIDASQTYYAKAFRLYGEAKDYGAKSNDLTLDYHFILPTPTLVQEVDSLNEAYYYDNTTDDVATDVHITVPVGFNQGNADGYEVFEQLSPLTAPVVGGLTDTVTLHGDLEAQKVFYARLYKDVNGTRVYSDNSAILSLQFNNAAPLTPVLNHVLTNNEYYYYDITKNQIATKVSVTDNNPLINGYDVFDAETDELVIGGNINDEVVIYGNIGVEKSYYAKTYRLYGDKKHYSPASDDLEFNFSNGVDYTPVLSLDWYSAIDENGYNKYYVDLDGKLSADVSINVTEQTINTIDGYDVFDSNDVYVTTGLPDEHVKLNGIIDEGQTYYAKAFRLYGNEKDYSAKSNDLTLDYHFVLPIPTLLQEDGSVSELFYYDSVTGMIATDVHISLPVGFNQGNADGYEVYEQLAPQTSTVGELNGRVTLYGTLGQPKVFYARLFKTVNGVKVYSDPSSDLQLIFRNELPGTPTLVQQAQQNGDLYYYDKMANKIATNVNITVDSSLVDGYDVFDAETNQVVTGGGKNDIVAVFGNLGVEKSYYAKTYRLYGNLKDYSEASGTLTFDFRNGVSYTPVLSMDWDYSSDPAGYTKYYFNEQGVIYTDISINSANVIDLIDGYDVFDSSNDEFVVEGLADEHLAITGIENQAKTYYAKAYRLYGDEKDYSAKSNDLTLDFIMAIPAPTLRHDWNNVDDPYGYAKYFYDDDVNMFGTDVSIALPSDVTVSPFDGYTVFNSRNEEVVVASSTEEHVVVHGNLNVEDTFYAKLYRLKGQTRVYGEQSNSLIFDFKNNFPKLELTFAETNKPYNYDVLINSEDFSMSDVDGIEFYYKNNDTPLNNIVSTRGGYQLLELDFADSDHTKPLDTRLYDIPNKNYTIKARPYKTYGEGNNAVTNYGEYSDEDVVVTTIPVPYFEADIGSMMCQNGLCNLTVWNIPTDDAIFHQGNTLEENVYYYNYIDLFEENVEEPVLEGIPVYDSLDLTGIPKGSTKSYYARSYVMYKGEKEYSEPSPMDTITFMFDPVVPSLVVEQSKDSPYDYIISIDNNFDYYSDDEFNYPMIEGIEFAIQTSKNQYEPIELPYYDTNGLTDPRVYNVPNKKEVIYARVYQIGLNGNKVYGDYTETGVEVGTLIPTPTFAVDLPTMECTNLLCYVDFGSGIDDSYLYYEDPVDPSLNIYYFDNVDLFEVGEDEDTLVLANIPLGGAARLETGVPKGSIKTYYARAYVMHNNKKVYGPKSATQQVEYLFDVEDPVLEVENGYTPYEFNISLSNKNSYVTGGNGLKIEGIEFYTMDQNGDYLEITLPLLEDGTRPIDDHVYGIPNTQTTIYARVYQIGLDNRKIYSDYSTLGVDVGRMIPTPILSVDMPTMDCVDQLCYVDFGSGADDSLLFYDDPDDPSLDVYYFDNIDLFEENNDVPVLTGIPTGGAHRLETGVPKGSTKNYYARAYVMFGNQKVYGPMTATQQVVYLFDVDAPVLDVQSSATPYSFRISLLNDNSYISGSNNLKIEGIEFYTKNENNEYLEVNLPFVGGGSKPTDDHVYSIPNTQTQLYARVYQTGLNDQKVYSDYSTVGVNVGRMIPAPSIAIGDLVCEDDECTMDFMNDPIESTYFTTNPDVYYYDYIDLFEEVENSDDVILLEAIPTAGYKTLNVPKGATKAIYARAYVLFGNQKVYGPKTSTESLTFLYSPTEPMLTVEKVEEVPYTYVVSIDNTFDYFMGENDEIVIIDGVDFFTKDENEEYHLIELPYYDKNEVDFLDPRVYDIPNQVTYLYAAAYQYDQNHNKVYTDYSPEGVKVGEAIPVPKLYMNTDTIACDNNVCSIKFDSPIYPGNIFHDDVNNENDTYYYDYVDLFEVGVTAPILEEIPLGEGTILENVPVNATKSYYVKAYVPYVYGMEGEDEVKIYSDASNVVEVTFTPPIDLISFEDVSTISTANASLLDNAGIILNSGKYSVTRNGNNITIADNGMIPYIGGNISTPKKWAGILVDLGVKVVGTGYYTINPEDYNDAARWGATNDTTFVMWLTKEDDSRTYTFANVDDSTDTIALTVDFTEDMPMTVQLASPIDTTNADPQTEADIIANAGRYNVRIIDGNTVQVIDEGIIPYVGGNISTEKKWVGILVDFGTKVFGTGNYLINEQDYTDARRWGATNDSTFIMWLTTEQGGTYSFQDSNKGDDDRIINLTITFDER